MLPVFLFSNQNKLREREDLVESASEEGPLDVPARGGGGRRRR